jgi:ABC-type transporter Mla maintaining outer membrane lipid asymmetry ATPase subunit MlaF
LAGPEFDCWLGSRVTTPERRDAILRKTGVTYQAGGLWSSMALAENVALPLE